MTSGLVLSIFPGIGILDTAFEEEGFCIVRGPDLLWGGDIKRFHPPEGVFDGVIGGPPCQAHSILVHIVRYRYGEESVAEDLIPEFIRVIEEAQPRWFVMENVRAAPIPCVAGYSVDPTLLNNRWLGEEQSRLHRFSFGTHDGRTLDYSPDLSLFENAAWSPRVLASGSDIQIVDTGRRKHHRLGNLGRISRRNLKIAAQLQGLPEEFFDHTPFTIKGAYKALGNAVPLFMSRALAKAVKRALDIP